MRQLVISLKTTIKQAIRRLNDGGKKILLVADDEGRLAGSLTDGDIRRAILSGRDFSSSVDSVMNLHPHWVQGDEDRRARAKELMLAHEIEQIPVLDGSGQILEVISWVDLFAKDAAGTPARPLRPVKPVPNAVVVMAGGKGTRLDPLTRILPKPLIPLGEKPIIEILIENFRVRGLSRFILVLNYKKELIRAFFQDNHLPYSVSFAEETDFLGTAGGLSLLKGRVRETFFVTNCDVILEAEFEKILDWHKSEKALMTLIGTHREVKIPYGLIKIDGGGFKAVNEKPVMDMVINSGVYVLEPEVMTLIEPNEFLNMNDLIERVSKKGRVSVYPVYRGWFDTGEFKEYQEALGKVGSHEKQGGKIEVEAKS